MGKKYYANERNVLILISLLKVFNIRKIIASPGTRNFSFVASLQQDSFFEMYSCIDERSAAYMACGLAEESGEPVVITCTGATASRNYMPGLTEAYYRKLPVLAVTGDTDFSRIGHLQPQVIDRSSQPLDICLLSERINPVKDPSEEWDAVIRVNRALLELTHHGGGPVHIDLVTGNCQDFSIKQLPTFRVIKRWIYGDELPAIEADRIAIYIGSHKRMSSQEIEIIDGFCNKYNAIVFCDHTSGYYGKYKIQAALINWQLASISDIRKINLLIHIGEVSGDYPGAKLSPRRVWRISEDGELRDTFKSLTDVFEMPEQYFFKYYCGKNCDMVNNSFYEICKKEIETIYSKTPELPLSNVYVAQQMHQDLPCGSVLHFGILNSLRAWNFFPIHPSIESHCNVGGFGIDGALSTIVGASLADLSKLHFVVLGDLAFFYDMNALGNRALSPNVRILLINNGRGVEFRIFCHPAFSFGKDANNYIAAAGHNSCKSEILVRSYVESLGFEYLSAHNKDELIKGKSHFLSSERFEKPMLFEVFTDESDENQALEIMANLEKSAFGIVNKVANQLLSPKTKESIKSIIHR